jgi:hypothetical protein
MIFFTGFVQAKINGMTEAEEIMNNRNTGQWTGKTVRTEEKEVDINSNRIRPIRSFLKFCQL